MSRLSVDIFSSRIAGLLAPARCHWCRSRLAQGYSCAACQWQLPWSGNTCLRCALPLNPSLSQPDPAAAVRLCRTCRQSPPPQDRAFAAFAYAPPITALILDLKFHGRLAAAPLLAELLARPLCARPEPLPDWLLPVPLHASRLRRRGYNQAGEIACALARQLSLRYAPTAVRRTVATAEQTRLSAHQRHRNLRGAFAVDMDLHGKKVAVLDDVITTGATAAELAGTLRKAGAASIEVWAVARATLRT